MVIADLNEMAGVAAAEALKASFVRLDVSDGAAVTAAAKEVFETFGRVDVLVISASWAERLVHGPGWRGFPVRK